MWDRTGIHEAKQMNMEHKQRGCLGAEMYVARVIFKMLINGTISRLAKKKTGDTGDPRDKFTPRATQKNGSNMQVLS